MRPAVEKRLFTSEKKLPLQFNYIFLFFIFFIVNCSLLTINCIAQQQPTQEWVRRYIDTTAEIYNIGLSVKQDGNGNLYVLKKGTYGFSYLKYDQSGNILLHAYFNPPAYNNESIMFDVTAQGEVVILGTSSTSLSSWFNVVKFNSNGLYQWNKIYEGVDASYGTWMKIDASGNIIVAGGYTLGNQTSGVLVKYSILGDTVWTRSYTLSQIGLLWKAAAIDNANNIVVTGNYSLPWRSITVKYSSNGNQVWTRQYTIDSSTSESGYGVAIDQQGYIYVLMKQDVPFKSFNIYLIKIASSGNIVWSRLFTGIINGQFGNNYLFVGPAISSDGSSIYYSTMTRNNLGSFSVATLKYNNSGDSIWTNIFNGGGTFGDNRVASLKLDRQDNVYICGSGNYTGSGDDFIAVKYLNNGSQQWVTIYNGLVGNGGDGASDILIDTSLNVYVTGRSTNLLNTGYTSVTIKYNQYLGISNGTNNAHQTFSLSQNYPNPFNGSTIIYYDLKFNSRIVFKIYNTLGQNVKSYDFGEQNPSTYKVILQLDDLPSGIYFYRLQLNSLNRRFEELQETKKMILIK